MRRRGGERAASEKRPRTSAPSRKRWCRATLDFHVRQRQEPNREVRGATSGKRPTNVRQGQRSVSHPRSRRRARCRACCAAGRLNSYRAATSAIVAREERTSSACGRFTIPWSSARSRESSARSSTHEPTESSAALSIVAVALVGAAALPRDRIALRRAPRSKCRATCVEEGFTRLAASQKPAKISPARSSRSAWLPLDSSRNTGERPGRNSQHNKMPARSSGLSPHACRHRATWI